MLTILILICPGTIWLMQALDAWKARRLVKRECEMLDLELKAL